MAADTQPAPHDIGLPPGEGSIMEAEKRTLLIQDTCTLFTPIQAIL